MTMNDLANTWKVGLVFAVLVVLRFLLTAEGALLQRWRQGFFAALSAVFGARDARRRDVEEGATPAERLQRSTLEFVDSGVIALALVFFLIRPFVIQAFYIPSGSMEPTLLVNDKILVNKFVYRFREPRRGDVVVFKAPPEADPEQKDFIKRLIALPGDTVSVERNRVILNGKPLAVTEKGDEVFEASPGGDDRKAHPVILGPDYRDLEPLVVPPGHVWVMGDHRNDSRDSRYWGPLEMRRIRGKAMVIFWPPTRVGPIP
jgi:signal peptidase I